MKRIKTLTVVSQSIKDKMSGLIKYMDYLNNPKAESHQNTNIVNLFKDKNKPSDFIKKCITEAAELDLANLERRKGGRPVASYAVSFDFTLPKGTIRPTKEQWAAVAKDIYKLVSDNTDEKITPEHVYMNVHDQDNPHLNLMVSKVINGNRERKIDQKRMLNILKTGYSNSILKHCGFDYKEYVPEEVNLGKRKEKWAYDLDQIKKAQKQFESLIQYVNENNAKRILSTKNRIVKSLKNISENNKNEFLDQISQVNDPELQKLKEEIRMAVSDDTTESLKSNLSSQRPKMR